MLIDVISDSHNNDRAIKEVRNYIKDSDILLFLGHGENDIANITKLEKILSYGNEAKDYNLSETKRK